MRTVVIIIAVALLCGCSHSISSKDAAQHLGQRCTVEGVVASVHVTGHRTVFLNFDDAYPRQTFAAVSLYGKLPPYELRNFARHTIRVSGMVQEYKGSPEIVLNSLDQISLVK